METVEVVIRIPKDEYNYIQLFSSIKTFSTNFIAKQIKNGNVLPKGHGRLGDLDALYHDISNGIKAGNYEEGYEDFGNINSMDDIMENIKYAPTVIEADKERI